MSWQVLSSRLALDNPHFSVNVETVLLPNGETTEYCIEKRRDWVAIFALTPNNEVIVIREYRHGSRQYVLGLPMGHIEHDDSPIDTAARELREETGYAARDYTLLQSYHANPSRSATLCHLFIAHDVTPGHRGTLPTDYEDIAVQLIPVPDVVDMLKTGAFDALPSCGLIYTALHHLGLLGKSPSLPG